MRPVLVFVHTGREQDVEYLQCIHPGLVLMVSSRSKVWDALLDELSMVGAVMLGSSSYFSSRHWT